MAKIIKEDFSSVLKQAVQTPVQATKQKVVEIKEAPQKTKFTLNIPTEMYNQLKMLAITRTTPDKKVFLQDLINDAIEEAYCKKKEK